MSAKSWQCEIHINDRQLETVTDDGADIAYLTTALCIKRRVIEEHFNTRIVAVDNRKHG